MLVPALPVYTDGSYCTNTGAGGWGVMLPCKHANGGTAWESLSGRCDEPDNNAVERYAVMKACERLLETGMAKGRHVRVYTDSTDTMARLSGDAYLEAGAESVELVHSPAHQGSRNAQSAHSSVVDRLAKEAMREYRDELLSGRG